MQGETGMAGANGAGIAARAANTADFVASGTSTLVPLTGNTWTQNAGEVDMIVGSLVENVTGCVPPSGGVSPQLFLVYLVDGNELVYQTVVGSFASTYVNLLPQSFISQAAPTSNVYFPSQALPIIPDPDTATNRTLTVTIRDNCTTSAHITVTSLKLRVLRFL